MQTSRFIYTIICIVIVTAAAIYQIVSENLLSAAPPKAVAEAQAIAELPSAVELATMPALSEHVSLSPRSDDLAAGVPQAAGQDAPDTPAGQEQAEMEETTSSLQQDFLVPASPQRDLSFLRFYVYAETLPPERPADIVLSSLKGVSVGTPLEEIKRAALAFGLNFNFMKAVAKIESDFDPKQRTGSYMGLFQLSHYEFDKYGSGDIFNPRDNSIAAAYKFLTEATLFEWDTDRKPTFSDLYLIHQQGWQGAAEHVAHPQRIAWKSMCATDEGREKGEKWCKRAIWANTLPAIKRIWKSVDNLTSAAFVTMWRERVDHLYARYSEATADDSRH